MMATKICYIFIITVLTALPAVGGSDDIQQQSNDSTIRKGQPIPEITFDNLLNWPSSTFSTQGLNKPTVLYFLSTGCISSFKPLSDINEMYRKYARDFNLLIVALYSDDAIESIYEQYARTYEFKMPAAFDKVVYKRYNIHGVPHVVWINEKGIVEEITNVIAEEYLRKFIKGEAFNAISYDPGARAKRRQFSRDDPFLLNGNGGDDGEFIQRSLLAEWKIGMPNDMPSAEANKNPLEGLPCLQAIGRELADLYRIAYFGKTYGWHPPDSAYGSYHYSPILEIRDKSKFQSDYSLGRNLFCYSQVLPPERRNPAEMMEVMQRDLKNFFGYDVVVETRMMPYLSLITTDRGRKQLLHRGGSGEYTHSLVRLHLIDQPVYSLIRALSYDLNLTLNDQPLIDETGIHGNIDVTLNAIMTDMQEVKKALHKAGLDIIQKEKSMKVIVIKDPDLPVNTNQGE